MALFKGNLFSEATHLTTQVYVVYPDAPSDVGTQYNGVAPQLLYLLHGWSGNAADWCRMTRVEYYAKRYNFIVVMPEVQHSSYSNMVYGMNYYDYVAHELPQLVGKVFNVPAKREDTFLAGLSMGGFGTLKIGLSNPGQFAGIASFSGAPDPQARIDSAKKQPDSTEKLRDMLAVYGEELKVPAQSDISALAKAVAQQKDRPRLLQLCGTEDFLYEDNQRLRKALEKAGYGATYLEWKDAHTWPFWDKSVELAMRFFKGETITEKKVKALSVQAPLK